MYPQKIRFIIRPIKSWGFKCGNCDSFPMTFWKWQGSKKNNMQLLASNINKTITLQRQAFHQLIVQLIRVGVFNPSEKLLVKLNYFPNRGENKTHHLVNFGGCTNPNKNLPQAGRPNHSQVALHLPFYGQTAKGFNGGWTPTPLWGVKGRTKNDIPY